MATFRIRVANIAMSDLAPDLPRLIETSGDSLSLQLVEAESLSETAQNAIYTLFNDNMSRISQGTSLSHEEGPKREELFDPDTRFLLLLRPVPASPMTDSVAMPGALPKSVRQRSSGGKGKEKATVDFDYSALMGFGSFRFDTEETLRGSDAEVVYCYELQLKEELRGKGMARRLMDEMERIGRERGMSKCMLTCLTANTSALRFYKKQGYEPDEIDPTRMDQEENDEDDDEWEKVGSDGEPVKKEEEDPVDYTILSKSLI